MSFQRWDQVALFYDSQVTRRCRGRLQLWHYTHGALHNDTQLELNRPAYLQPVQLQKTGRNVVATTQLNKKVSYRKEIARQHFVVHSENFYHAQFDHHAKIGCFFSYCACRRSQKFGEGKLGPTSYDGGVADPWKQAPPPYVLYYHTKFRRSVKPCRHKQRVPKMLGALGPHPLGRERGWPRHTLLVHMCYSTNLVALG